LLHWLLKRTSNPVFGPAPYGSVLFLFVGALISTPLLNFFFMNINVTGESITLRSYIAGGIRPHIKGAWSGLVFAIGALAVSLAVAAQDEAAPQQALILILPFLSCAVCVWLGVKVWGEFSKAPRKAWTALWTSLSCFVVGLVLAGTALAS
jgi:hypothetical protein